VAAAAAADYRANSRGLTSRPGLFRAAGAEATEQTVTEMVKFSCANADTPRDERSPGIRRATRGVAAGAAGLGAAWRQREHAAALGGLGKGGVAPHTRRPAAFLAR